MKNLLKTLSEIFKDTWNEIKSKSKPLNKSLKLVLRSFFRFLILSLAVCLLVGKFVACRSPTAHAENITVGNSHTYMLPTVTLSSPRSNYAVLPSPILSINFATDILDERIKITLPSYSTAKVASYVTYTLFYDAPNNQYGAIVPSFTTIHGSSAITSVTGLTPYTNTSKDVYCRISNFSALAENDAVFTDGYIIVNSTAVQYIMVNEYGQLTLTIYYTSALNAITDYEATFNPLRIVTNASYKSIYDVGYDEGFDDGFDEGIRTEWDSISPLRVFKNSIDDLFDTQIFGDISLGSIVRIGFAVILLGFVIKIFLGG